MTDRLPRLLRAVGSTLTLLAVLLVVAPAPIGGHLGVAVVRGTSMQPLYETGDLVITLRSATYDPGEILLYESGQGRVIHRVVSGNGLEGYVTQGDNRAVIDEWRPTSADVVGRAVLHVPALGHIISRTQDVLGPGGLMALSMLAVVVAARPRRRRFTAPWAPGSREVALAAFAIVVAAGGLFVLGARVPDGSWSLPLSRSATGRIAVLLGGLGLQVAIVALAVGRGAHVRLRTAAIDLALGSRVVDVDELDLTDRVIARADSARDLRRAADLAASPVLRLPHPDLDGHRSYLVVGPDLALVLDSVPASAGRSAQESPPAVLA